MKHTRRHLPDPAQTEMFAVVWLSELSRPFLLHAGDVIRVNESAAIVIINRPVRNFTTRFDKPVRFQQPPATHRISSNSEVPILNR